jgi:hypothetical protein
MVGSEAMSAKAFGFISLPFVLTPAAANRINFYVAEYLGSKRKWTSWPPYFHLGW